MKKAMSNESSKLTKIPASKQDCNSLEIELRTARKELELRKK